MALNAFSDANVAKITEYVRTKTVTKVISQVPAAGTPVLEGMTIQVRTVSLSDVPYFVLEPDAPVAVRNTPLSEIEKVIQNDDLLKAVATTGTVTDAQRATVTEKLNTGLVAGGFTGTLSPAEAEKIVKSFSGFSIGF